MPEDNIYDDDLEFASIESEADLKRLKLSDGSVGQSKLSPGLQSRLGIGTDGIDSLQGYRVIVSNLHPIVTKQDVVVRDLICKILQMSTSIHLSIPISIQSGVLTKRLTSYISDKTCGTLWARIFSDCILV